MTITTNRVSISALQLLSEMTDGELKDMLERDPYSDDGDYDWEMGEDIRGKGREIAKGSKVIICKNERSAKWLLKAIEKHTNDGVVVD